MFPPKLPLYTVFSADLKGKPPRRRLLKNGIRRCTLKVSRCRALCHCGGRAHVAGKTAEAKTDLARLQEVRRRREQAAAQREAEAEGQLCC